MGFYSIEEYVFEQFSHRLVKESNLSNPKWLFPEKATAYRIKINFDPLPRNKVKNALTEVLGWQSPVLNMMWTNSTILAVPI